MILNYIIKNYRSLLNLTAVIHSDWSSKYIKGNMNTVRSKIQIFLWDILANLLSKFYLLFYKLSDTRHNSVAPEG